MCGVMCQVFGTVWASPARRRCHTALHSAGAAQYTAAVAHLPRVCGAASSHMPHANNAQQGPRGTGRGTSLPVQGASHVTGHTFGHTLMERARRLFIAALRFAPPGCYSVTARMVCVAGGLVGCCVPCALGLPYLLTPQGELCFSPCHYVCPELPGSSLCLAVRNHH